MLIQPGIGTVYRESENDFVPQKVTLYENDVIQTRKDSYRIDKILGKGGFGTVCKIISCTSNQTYALKVLNLWEMRPDEFQFLTTKFVQGFKTGRISSSNIVRSFEMGFLMSNPYIVMEFCPNKNLEDNLLYFESETMYLKLASEILDGLDALHQNGVIHRDIKPENILFDANMVAKLTDFDLSGHLNNRLTHRNFFGHAKVVFGTVAYSAPEQLKHTSYYKMTLPSMDLYSFAATMYFVLSKGKNPFGVSKPDLKEIEAYKKKKETESPVPISRYNPELDKKWDILMEKCLNPNPKKRVQSVNEVKSILGLHDWRNISISGPRLFIINKDKKEEILLESFNKGVVLVGRENNGENDIEIREYGSAFISRKQFTLERINNNWILRDGQMDKELDTFIWRNSSNGTYVNNQIITGRAFHKLSSGDIIAVGDCVIKFLII